ncbi:ATP-binding domain-containing protein [Patellaria atrata CBS 101060]|uniref:GPN-loop GTPase 2 n=1 Tax=Patellaria atrata CBS 101060 TaxID=1346257 RepID=A0A9P4SC08_9PEZI|nr:ATP-binding domain-containing protein [Patellaria atrata CBS 101060]
MPFAQLVVGPPGSGKSTYCDGMQQFMNAIGRKCSIVNLDPANDHTSYTPAVDVRQLIPLEEVMEAEELGPNGGILYALEELEDNIEWLEDGLKELGEDYVIFDCPGQVELFTHHASLRNIFFRLQKFGYRLVVLHMTDSYVLTSPPIYISALLLALRTMLQMDLPHLNVLTKIDKLNEYPPLPFNLDFYTEVQDLEYLLPHLASTMPSASIPAAKQSTSKPGSESEDDSPRSKFDALNRAIIDLVTDFSLVGFETLAVEDKTSMMMLLRAIDRAGGYVFGGAEGANDTVWQVAMREGATTMDVRDVQERWIDRRDELDDQERNRWEEEAKQLREGPGGTGITEETKQDVDSDEDIEAMSRMIERNGIKIVRKSDLTD